MENKEEGKRIRQYNWKSKPHAIKSTRWEQNNET